MYQKMTLPFIPWGYLEVRQSTANISKCGRKPEIQQETHTNSQVLPFQHGKKNDTPLCSNTYLITSLHYWGSCQLHLNFTPSLDFGVKSGGTSLKVHKLYKNKHQHF